MTGVGSRHRLEALRIDRNRTVARKTKKRIAAALVVGLLAALAVLVLLRRPPQVLVAEVREARPGEAATELTAAGYVSSERRSTVAPKIPGRLVQVAVKEGQHVEQGDVLARLDDKDQVVGLRQAEAQAGAAAADAASARAARAKADRDLDQMTRLAASGAISPTALLDTRTAADAARAGELAALARQKAADDVVAQAKIRLDTVVRAPFSGTVSKKLADEGAVLAPAAVSDIDVGGIVELVDLDTLGVDAELGEDRLASVHEGQPALIFLDAYPDKFYEGVTGTIRPTIDRAKATAVIKVPFLAPPEGVFPNMGAKVSFLSRKLDADALAREPRLRVPRSAVVTIDGHDAVWVVEGGRVRHQVVTVAAQAGDEVSLSDGPPPGTTIVSAAGPKLKDGARVRVVTGAA